MQPQQAVAEVHDGFAGRGQVVRRYLVEPAPALHDCAGPAQHGEVFGGGIAGAAGGDGQFADHARLAGAQGEEDFPAGVVAERGGEELWVNRRHGRRGIGVRNGRIHWEIWIIENENQGKRGNNRPVEIESWRVRIKSWRSNIENKPVNGGSWPVMGGNKRDNIES